MGRDLVLAVAAPRGLHGRLRVGVQRQIQKQGAPPLLGPPRDDVRHVQHGRLFGQVDRQVMPEAGDHADRAPATQVEHLFDEEFDAPAHGGQVVLPGGAVHPGAHPIGGPVQHGPDRVQMQSIGCTLRCRGTAPEHTILEQLAQGDRAAVPLMQQLGQRGEQVHRQNSRLVRRLIHSQLIGYGIHCRGPPVGDTDDERVVAFDPLAHGLLHGCLLFFPGLDVQRPQQPRRACTGLVVLQLVPRKFTFHPHGVLPEAHIRGSIQDNEVPSGTVLFHGTPRARFVGHNLPGEEGGVLRGAGVVLVLPPVLKGKVRVQPRVLPHVPGIRPDVHTVSTQQQQRAERTVSATEDAAVQGVKVTNVDVLELLLQGLECVCVNDRRPHAVVVI
mmetsp:Transcript_22937/g.41305  ORF Transcript_22937/g.41305 Transcript_22937/m.41305 type:complete len:386 (-) Transcript_22937:807-1964(-)